MLRMYSWQKKNTTIGILLKKVKIMVLKIKMYGVADYRSLKNGCTHEQQSDIFRHKTFSSCLRSFKLNKVMNDVLNGAFITSEIQKMIRHSYATDVQISPS